MSRLTGNRKIGWTGLVIALALCGGGGALAAEPSVEMAFGTGLDRTTRTLTGEGTVFAAGDFSAEAGSVVCLTRLAQMPAPTVVTHVWYHKGKTKARVELNVGGSNWRTWSSKRILPAWTGAWEVKVLDADGMVLASSGFMIE